MNEMKLPSGIRAVMDRLENAGYACYAVGGAVRDWLSGRVPHDYDLCTAALPEETKRLFDEFHVIETGLKHGTVTILVDGEPIEVTTFRTETSYSDGRHPDKVEFVTDIEKDLARRDFTVNAMAWSPTRGLCDPFGGQEDLKNKIIRCVGDPDTRLQEDALRILRALRFSAQRGYDIESETADALRRNKEKLAQVSAERITEELLQILCGTHVGKVLMEYSDIIVQILPEIAPMIGFEQHNSYHKYTVWEHSVRALESIRPEPALRLAMLLHDIGKPHVYTMDEKGIGHFYGHPKISCEITKQVLRRLRLSAQMEQQVLYLVRHHDTPLGHNVRHIRRKLAVHGEETFRQLLAVKKADGVGQSTTPRNLTELIEVEQIMEQVLKEESCLTRKDLAVNGRDLAGWGAQGKEIGFYLSAMLSRVLEDPSCNTREQLYELFRSLKEQQGCMEFTVNGMSSRFCARQVKQILEDIPGVNRIEITLESGRAAIYGQNIPFDQVRERLMAAGYEVPI